jgi:hypothetical protein
MKMEQKMKLFLKFKCCLLGAAILLSGCNKQIIDLEYKFNKAYAKWPDGTVKVIEISKWKDFDNSDQIQIISKDGKVYLFHSVNVVLVKE